MLSLRVVILVSILLGVQTAVTGRGSHRSFDTTQDEKLEHIIREGNDKWMSAFNKGDSDEVANCYTEDARLMPPGSDVLIGRENVSKALGEMMHSGVKKAVLTIDEVGYIHPTLMAYERSHYTFYNAEGTVLDHGKYVVIWKNVTGDFYLYTDIMNSNSKASNV